MKKNPHLRLSLFTVPELSIGRAPLTPQNSQFDPRRLTYLEGMVAYLNGLLESPEALSRLHKLLAQVPHAELVKLGSSGEPRVTEVPSARDRIVFNRDRVRINFLDGLHRRAESPGIPAGRYSPQIS